MRLNSDGRTLIQVANSDINPDGSFIIPNGVTTIAKKAFFKCHRLKICKFPSSVLIIEDHAFAGCINLTVINFNTGIVKIGYEAFENCPSLQMVSLPDGVVEVSSGAFSACTGLQIVKLPDSVKSIEYGVFQGCTSLIDIALSKNISKLRDRTFEGCVSLKNLIMPKSLNTIEHAIFEGCKFDSIQLSHNVTAINKFAFKGCLVEAILIDSDDEKIIADITRLLPHHLQNKAISLSLANVVFEAQAIQLTKLTRVPQTNPLFRFFSTSREVGANVKIKHRQDKDYVQLHNDIFQHINSFLGNHNPYYRRVKTLILQEPWPKNKDQLTNYKNNLEKIVNNCLTKITEFTQPNISSDNKRNNNCSFS